MDHYKSLLPFLSQQLPVNAPWSTTWYAGFWPIYGNKLNDQNSFDNSLAELMTVPPSCSYVYVGDFVESLSLIWSESRT